MMMQHDSSFYPANPVGVPAELTAINRQYRWQIVLVLVYLTLFVLLYLALLGGAGYLLYLSVRFAIHAPQPVFLKSLAAVGASLLVVFLVRPLIRKIKSDQSLLLQIDEASQPVLFAFLRRLCEDIGAPLPGKVFLSPEVNAAVVSSTSPVNLLARPRQDLVIGLGLVNALNLMEFKAVLAHEFGHFTQKGTRLGAYVYSWIRLIAEMRYGSGRVEYLLHRLLQVAQAILQIACADIRLALCVLPVLVLLYLLIGVVKGFAALLQGLHKLIGLASLSLSRQMEFNADLVAVSLTGSDAPVNVLVRLPLANDALTQVAQDLTTAAEAGLHTRDLFYHQHPAALFLRTLSGKPDLGEPPTVPDHPGPRADIFAAGDTAVPPMWETHPPNYQREQNAKRCYIRSPVDERPAWVLFQEAPALREKLTRRFYQHLLQRADLPLLAEPATVQAFIDEEHAEATFPPRYLGAYDDRYLEPGDPSALVAQARTSPWDQGRLLRAPAELFSAELRPVTEGYASRLRDLEVLRVAESRPEFEFRGQKYHQGQAARLTKEVSRELTAYRQRLTALDRDVFLAHYQMARQLGSEVEKELMDRYGFQMAVQRVLAQLTEQRDWLHAVLYFLSQRKEMTSEEYAHIIRGARAIGQVLSEQLASADAVNIPPMRNNLPGQSFSRLLLRDRTEADLRLDERALKPKRMFSSLMGLLQAVSKIRDRAHRLHFKSLAGVLAFQETIQARWSAEAGALADPSGDGSVARTAVEPVDHAPRELEAIES